MAYRIQYTTISPDKYTSVKKRAIKKQRKKWIGFAVLLLCALIGRKLYYGYLQYTDVGATDAAVDTMIRSIMDGDGLYEAVSTFCLEVIENGR